MSIDPTTANQAKNVTHLEVEWNPDEATVWCYLAPARGPVSIRSCCPR